MNLPFGSLRIERVSLHSFFDTVCNFEVAELRCYAVGRGGILVYNNDGTDEKPGNFASRAFDVDSGQLGKKLGKHAQDFGLDPANPAHRAQITDLIDDIGRNPERAVPGSFRGQGPGGARGPVEFRIKENDVVVTTPDGKFVTILKDGINNPSVVEALKNAGG